MVSKATTRGSSRPRRADHRTASTQEVSKQQRGQQRLLRTSISGRARELLHPSQDEHARRPAGTASAEPAGLQRVRVVVLARLRCRAPSAGILVDSWHEHQLSLGRRAIQQFVRVASLGERQALRDDRMDLGRTSSSISASKSFKTNADSPGPSR